jgi:hypothetical protein
MKVGMKCNDLASSNNNWFTLGLLNKARPAAAQWM